MRKNLVFVLIAALCLVVQVVKAQEASRKCKTCETVVSFDLALADCILDKVADKLTSGTGLILVSVEACLSEIKDDIRSETVRPRTVKRSESPAQDVRVYLLTRDSAQCLVQKLGAMESRDGEVQITPDDCT